MKLTKLAGIWGFCMLFASCATATETDQNAYANLPREESSVIFEFDPMPSTAQETSDAADAIVYGSVLSVSATSNNVIISTSIEFSVEKSLKGDIEPGDVIIIKTNDGAMLRSELRRGYTGALKNAADRVNKKQDTKLSSEEDALVVQLMPYGGLFTPGTREVLCLGHRDEAEKNMYYIAHGAYCRQIELADGEFADISEVKDSMEKMGFSELKAPDPALMPENLSEKVEEKYSLEQIEAMYGLQK